MVAPPRLRSPLARAVVPVLGGLAFFAVLGLATFGIAAFITDGGGERSETLFPTTYEVGSVEPLSETIAEDGPLLMRGLNTSSAKRNIVLDHTGDDPRQGWIVYWAYPADRTDACPVRQQPGTSTFTDCDGRRLGVTDLAPPPGVFLRVADLRLVIDLRNATG